MVSMKEAVRSVLRGPAPSKISVASRQLKNCLQCRVDSLPKLHFPKLKPLKLLFETISTTTSIEPIAACATVLSKCSLICGRGKGVKKVKKACRKRLERLNMIEQNANSAKCDKLYHCYFNVIVSSFLAGSSTQRPTCRWPQKAILLTSGVCVQHSSGQLFSWWKLLKDLVQNLFARDCLHGDGLSPHASAVWDVLRQCEAWSCVRNVKVSGIQAASSLSTRIAMFWTLILFYHSCMMLQV